MSGERGGGGFGAAFAIVIFIGVIAKFQVLGVDDYRWARSLSSNAASPRMNLDFTADDSCLDPHVSCVKTSHPAAQLDVDPEQRSVRQSMMSGPHHGDRAHTHTTFGTLGKFIRASSSSRSDVA
jgi:hypothetical protein